MPGTFELYNLKVEIVKVKEGLEAVCNHHLGDYFEVSGENISIPAGKTFSMYALAAVLPLLPAKQRVTSEHDWMTSRRPRDVSRPQLRSGHEDNTDGRS